MPNTNSPRGFAPRKSSIGAAWSATLDGYEYKVASGYATAIYENDVVKLVTAGVIQKAAAGEQFCGVVKGFKWVDAVSGATVSSPYWPAGTVTKDGKPAQAMVHADPNTVFEAQFTNSTSVPSQADVGANFNLFDAGGVAATGISGEGIDYSTLTTSAAQFRFLGFVTRADNDTSAAYSYGMFRPALHDNRVNTGI